MILIKYLSKEVLKSQVAILLILLLIFFSQQFIRVLGSATNGNVPPDLVFYLLGLAVPNMAQLMLPLSLFIALLLTFGRLYAESEITVMRACGIGQTALIKVACLLALITASVSAYNSFYLSPASMIKQEQLIENAKENPSKGLLSAGQFVNFDNIILFIDKIDNNDHLKDIYIFQNTQDKKQLPSATTAELGYIDSLKNGDQVLTLKNALRNEGNVGSANFRITHFDTYQAYLGYKTVNTQNNEEEMLTINQLWKNNSVRARAEWHWRLTLILAVPIMALVAVALSKVNPRQGRFAKILPALLIYLIYFLLQSSLKSAGTDGKINPSLWMPVVNIAFFILGIILNSWNGTFMTKVRANCYSLFHKTGVKA